METSEEIEEAFVGVNCGVAAISEFRRDQPTLICGTGRSGTTALARCFLNSDDVDFVTEDETDGSNLETISIGHAARQGDAEAWHEFRNNNPKRFVCKQPRFEHFVQQHEELQNVWDGANIILMTRDPLLVAMRQWSISAEQCAAPSFQAHALTCFNMSRKAVIDATAMSDRCGVLFVSYEKLITMPQKVADEINAWFAEERLTKKAMAQSIMPNNPYYLERQTLGWMRQMKDMKERRARGER